MWSPIMIFKYLTILTSNLAITTATHHDGGKPGHSQQTPHASIVTGAEHEGHHASHRRCHQTSVHRMSSRQQQGGRVQDACNQKASREEPENDVCCFARLNGNRANDSSSLKCFWNVGASNQPFPRIIHTH